MKKVLVLMVALLCLVNISWADQIPTGKLIPNPSLTCDWFTYEIGCPNQQPGYDALKEKLMQSMFEKENQGYICKWTDSEYYDDLGARYSCITQVVCCDEGPCVGVDVSDRCDGNLLKKNCSCSSEGTTVLNQCSFIDECSTGCNTTSLSCNPGSEFPYWILVLAGVVVIGGGGSYVLIKGKKKKK